MAACRCTFSTPVAFCTTVPFPAPAAPRPQRHRRKRTNVARATLADEPLLPLSQLTPMRVPEAIILRDVAHDSMVLEASQGVRTVDEMCTLIMKLRRQKLSLLLADLVARIRAEMAPHCAMRTLKDLLQQADALGNALLMYDVDEATLRASIRGMLWQLRQSLQSYNTSQWLRTSLEVARTACLDIPGRSKCMNDSASSKPDNAVLRSEMYALMMENILLEELKSLRLLERQLNAAILRNCSLINYRLLDNVSTAAARLGIDDYRVRGKTRLSNAVVSLKNAMQHQPGGIASDVLSTLDVLHNALVTSLETDLSVRRPAGQAMLLRPRIDDIPNFEIVSNTILRGGQPTSRGLEWLSHYGVSVVIDLRGSDRQNQWEMPKCRILPTLLDDGVDDVSPMRSCNIPIEDFCTPTMQQVQEFIELVDAITAKNGVVFVHCKAGIGRTGTLIACWRISQGEPLELALAKETLYSEGGGGLRQENFVREFALQYRKE